MNRTDLLKALKAVIPGVAKGEAALIGADSFTFRNGLIQSYNDNLSVTYPMDVGVEGSVKAAEFVKVLEKMSSLDVAMDADENSISLTDGITTLEMRLIDISTADLLASLALDELDWKPIPGNFKDAMKLCITSVSRNVVHGPLVGINVSGVDALSSDNFRATWVTLENPMGQFTVPGSSVSDLLKLENLEQYALSNAWVHFMSADGAVFSSRLIATEYPAEALKRMFPETLGEQYTLPEQLTKALERAAIMTYSQDGGLEYVNIADGSNGNLFITGERQYGSIKDKVKIKDGEWPDGVSINVQPNYLLDIMAMTREFQLANDGKLVCFHGDWFKHIIATIMT